MWVLANSGKKINKNTNRTTERQNLPKIAESKLLLPLPTFPTMATSSPFLILKLISLNITVLLSQEKLPFSTDKA